MVVDSMDPGLICINDEGKVIFTNKPARKLLQDLPLITLGDIRKYHPALADAIDTTHGYSGKVASLPSFKASVRCNSFLLGKGEYTLYSIQNIQNEVDAQEAESWQKLIRVLTHEIMNSLGPILSLSKSLKKSAGDQGKLLEGLGTIESTGEGLIHFITEYRKLSMLPPPRKEQLAYPSLFSHVESLFKEECKKWNVDLKVDIADGLPPISADRHQVEQVLINLVRNALESLEGSASAEVSLSANSEAGMVLIRVKDNGPGIPEKIADSIFVPFYSTKKGGSGIGLSLSRQIMLNHGGSLGFESIPGEFTVFLMRFPL
jgi:signal transduction histidine kinase